MEHSSHQVTSTPEWDEWIRELEAAFAPYPAFVREVSEHLRVITEESASARPVRKLEKPVLAERRILLIDDAELNRVLMSHYLKGLPVKMEFASTLERALDLCAQHSFDALVVDFELKGHTPETLISALRGASNARLMALSSMEYSLEAEEQALELGFQGYLSRGLSRQDLLGRLSSALWGS